MVRGETLMVSVGGGSDRYIYTHSGGFLHRATKVSRRRRLWRERCQLKIQEGDGITEFTAHVRRLLELKDFTEAYFPFLQRTQRRLMEKAALRPHYELLKHKKSHSCNISRVKVEWILGRTVVSLMLDRRHWIQTMTKLSSSFIPKIFSHVPSSQFPLASHVHELSLCTKHHLQKWPVIVNMLWFSMSSPVRYWIWTLECTV